VPLARLRACRRRPQNAHINELMKKHERSFAEIKNYYNDITHNNLDLIKALKEDVAEMKKREAQNEKLMYVCVAGAGCACAPPARGGGCTHACTHARSPLSAAGLRARKGPPLAHACCVCAAHVCAPPQV
jgi:hypothetical protein